MDMTTGIIGLRLDGSEALIRALDEQRKMYELAQELMWEREQLRVKLTTVRLLYAEVVHAQVDRMCVDLMVAEWEEIQVNVWRSPQSKIDRGVPAAWHAMRGMNLGSVKIGEGA